ncbi:hypothetical protein AB833_15965 [Chromatiales bacterium (ex Bugula neritina AB1)]|nr:hypothetical protein AB833_15965 [Chromatiales bacterium (ex Bugula neritina AB1)]
MQTFSVNNFLQPSATARNKLAQRLLRVEARDELPITLRHERIYILPTKRGLAFFAVIAVMLVASMNFGLNLGYALSFIFIGLIASCLLSTYLNLAQLQFTCAHAADCHACSPQNFSVTLRDPLQRQRHSITVTNADGIADTIDLKPGAEANITLQLVPKNRGTHALGRLTISSNFPLGLWRGWGYMHTPVSAYVYPNPETPCPDFAPQKTSTGEMISALTPDREFAELKQYQQTDSPGAVAWKSVARGAGWYSKHFDAEQRAIDLKLRWQDTPSDQNIEQRLSRLCAWILEAEKRSQHYAFELPGISRSANSGLDHQQRCLRDLASYQFEPGDTHA